MSIIKGLTAGVSLEARLKLDFFLAQKYWPDFENPRTFNEKVQVRKLYDRNPLFPILADKFTARQYVADILGDNALTKLYGVYDSPSELLSASIPNECVLKATNDSGSVLLKGVGENNEGNFLNSAYEYFSNRLTTSFAKRLHEWWYWEIQPRIVVEELLRDHLGNIPIDYKFFVFDGTVKLIQVDLDRHSSHRRVLYSREWEPLDLELGRECGAPILPPKDHQAMTDAAEQLATGLDFVRVDLYSLDNRPVIFGEYTFAPGSGFERFKPRTFDFSLGKHWNLKVGNKT